jgi:hypothetical protein
MECVAGGDSTKYEYVTDKKHLFQKISKMDACIRLDFQPKRSARERDQSW